MEPNNALVRSNPRTEFELNPVNNYCTYLTILFNNYRLLLVDPFKVTGKFQLLEKEALLSLSKTIFITSVVEQKEILA